MRLRIELLGRFRVTVDGRTVSAGEWRRSRSVALIKLLALAPGYRLHREQVMDALWPELAPDAAGRNLRKAVHYARRTLGTRDVIKLDGELLPDDPYAEWTQEPRERLRQLYARVLKAGRLWERVLEADPTDEDACRA